MIDRLHDNETATRHLFGKPYHWERVDGVLTLRPGHSPTDPPVPPVRTLTMADGMRLIDAEGGDVVSVQMEPDGTVTTMKMEQT